MSIEKDHVAVFWQEKGRDYCKLVRKRDLVGEKCSDVDSFFF